MRPSIRYGHASAAVAVRKVMVFGGADASVPEVLTPTYSWL